MSVDSMDYLYQEGLKNRCQQFVSSMLSQNPTTFYSNYLVTIQKIYWTPTCAMIVLNISDNWHAPLKLCGLLKYWNSSMLPQPVSPPSGTPEVSPNLSAKGWTLGNAGGLQGPSSALQWPCRLTVPRVMAFISILNTTPGYNHEHKLDWHLPSFYSQSVLIGVRVVIRSCCEKHPPNLSYLIQ